MGYNNLVYYIKEDKSSVQDFYAGVIGKALAKCGYEYMKTVQIAGLKDVPKDAILICISHYCVLEVYIKGYRNIIYWVQGSSPDESFMRNHSYIRKFIISAIERFALEKCKYCFMVSNALIEHYKKKYNKDYSYKTYVMPCYNTAINRAFFNTPDKYTNNKFCYVGGLSVWQNFPETVEIFKNIQVVLPDATFKVLTGDIEKAQNILLSKGIKNYEVNHVAPDELAKEISDCKFGFIVRSESPVNFVATPTKLSNYMGAGLIPIVSNTVGFFSEILKTSKYSVLLAGDIDKDVQSIKEIASVEINADDIYKEYNSLFDEYYNTEKHIDNISNLLKDYLA